jgi:hypothetical protein
MSRIGDWIFKKAVALLTEGTAVNHAITKSYVDNRTNILRTEEDFTVALDSSSGNDPTDGLIIYNQTSSDAWGAFKTIPAAVRALPQSIEHLVQLQLPDGNWLLNSGGLGDFTRHHAQKTPIINPSVPTGIEFTSLNGFTQVAGTPASMAVQSSSGGVVTLQSDPGLGADAFITYHLLVLSGTGAGQYKVIRTHAGTSFTEAGTYSPSLDVTSVVQIVEPAATLQIPSGLGAGNDENVTIQGPGISKNSLLRLGRVNIIGDNWAWIQPFDITMLIHDGLRIVEGGIQGGDTKVFIETCMIDAGGGWLGSPAILMTGGSVRDSVGTSRAFLFRGNATVGQPAISLQGNTGSNSNGDSAQTGYFFGAHAFDNWDYTFIYAQTKMSFVQIQGPNPPRGTPSPDYAVVLDSGAVLEVDTLAEMAGQFVGSVNDALVDGVGIDWTTIDADADDSAVGGKQSMVYGI